ncbi:hypothetical protein ES703_17447 [subsurface metagenome]
MLGKQRARIWQLTKAVELEEQKAFKGTKRQYDKMREEERIAFKKAHKSKIQKKKEAEEKEKKEKQGDHNAVYAYCRVSTEEQAREGLSLDRQKEDIEKYAEKGGYKIARWFVDDGYSGGKIDRPALQELKKAVEENAIEDGVGTVIALHSDRLARDLFIKLTFIYEVFEKHGIRLRAVTEDIDTETPEGKFMINITGAAAQFLKDRFAQHAKEISEYVWSKGEWKAPQAVPIGFRMAEDGKLEEDPEGMARVEKIIRLAKANKGKIHTDPTFLSHKEIGIQCGVSKPIVGNIAKLGLKKYIAKYAKYMAE